MVWDGFELWLLGGFLDVRGSREIFIIGIFFRSFNGNLDVRFRKMFKRRITYMERFIWYRGL